MKRPARVLGLALLVSGPALAQGGQPPFAERVPDTRMPSPVVEVGPLPNWSIKQEVTRLDQSMKEYNSLIGSLGSASKELNEELQKYLQNPHDPVQASSLDRKLAQYAQRVMGDFDGIIADQDVLSSNFNDLQRKLVVFSRHLASQADGYRGNLDGFRQTARDGEKRLTELAVRIRENPPEDPNELKRLKKEFAREFRSYRMQMRYVNGYNRRYQNYMQLQKNMERLAGVFVNLHEKFNELIDNLTNERQYLQDSVRLQKDTLIIKQIMRDGIMGSDQAIGNVAAKLADLYNQVDAFSTVHERISTDLNTFVNSNEELLKVTEQIDKIGTNGGSFGDIGGDMEKAIEAFYGRRAGEDKLLGDETGDEGIEDFGVETDEEGR